ncbi:hypothetical protein [Deinococcus hohokamensis]|uniref:Uncharacterized protein n=1 Tax=Deinococcus hohokamensis TaxID=309883 RepID=A0ABV9IA55_9DEIO
MKRLLFAGLGLTGLFGLFLYWSTTMFLPFHQGWTTPQLDCLMFRGVEFRLNNVIYEGNKGIQVNTEPDTKGAEMIEVRGLDRANAVICFAPGALNQTGMLRGQKPG